MSADETRSPGSARLLQLVAERNRAQAAYGREPLFPDQVYADAVWESSLTSTQKITALCYANHARNAEFPARDRAWAVYQRLMPQTGIRSRETIAKVHADLVALGWLESAGHRPGHKQIAVYLLTLPAGQASSKSGTGTESGTGTDSVPVRYGNRNRSGTESGTGSGNRTGTEIGPDQYGNLQQTGTVFRQTSTESGTRPSKDLPRDPLKESLEQGERSRSEGTQRPVDTGASAPTAIPMNFAITEELRIWAKANAADVDLDHETQKFVDHLSTGAKARTCKSNSGWHLAWKDWVKRSQRWQDRDSAQSAAPSGRAAGRGYRPAFTGQNLHNDPVQWDNPFRPGAGPQDYPKADR
jgi:hypothetical protein